MKPICLIPARSGSKGLPDKNMLFLDGKPMLFHTIDAAIESGCFALEDIYVSTDSLVYKDICETRGIKVLLRPAELSTDYTTSYQLNEHFLRDYEDDQVFVLLQVTSPLRTGQDIVNAMKLYESNDVDNVVSFTKADKTAKLFSKLDDRGFVASSHGNDKHYRRQDQEVLYYPNGAIYISSKAVYLKNQSYLTEKTLAYLMPKTTSIDVDDRVDFTSVLGNVFFNYQKRERENVEFYHSKYTQLAATTSEQNIIISDSRLVYFEKEGYANFSIGGVTIATVLRNLEIWLKKDTYKVVLSLGINDLIADYSFDVICQNFEQLVLHLLERGVKLYVTDVVYTLFRDSVKKEDVTALNSFIKQMVEKYQLPYCELNAVMSQDDYMKFENTADGLHFSELGKQRVADVLNVFLA